MNRQGKQRSLRAPHRFSAFAVALLWAVTPVLASLHASIEVHRYCAEHGVVEEAGAAEDADTPASAVQPGVRIGGVDVDEEAHHDDCAFAQFCRFGQTLIAFALAATGSLDPGAPPAPPADAPPSALAVIFVAPKTSPPV